MAHTKAVPELAKLASNKTFLIAGAAALAVGGVYLYSQRAQTSPNENSDAIVADNASLGGFYTSDPMSLGGIGPATSSGADNLGSILGGGGGNAPSTPNPITVASPTLYYDGGSLYDSPSAGQPLPFTSPTGIDPAAAEILSQQRLMLEYDFQYNMAVLDLQRDTNQANTWLSYQTLQTMEYTSAVALAQTFILSGNQASFTNVYGADGNALVSFAGVNMQDSKKDRWNETIAQNIGAISAGFANAVNNISGIRAPTPTTPWGYNEPPTANGSPVNIPVTTSSLTHWEPPTPRNPLPTISPPAEVTNAVYTPSAPVNAPTLHALAPAPMTSYAGGGRSDLGTHTMEL